MKTTDYGFIGVGRMGQRHCRVYANLRRTQLAGVYDINAKVAEQVKPLTKEEQASIKALPGDRDYFRTQAGMLPGVELLGGARPAEVEPGLAALAEDEEEEAILPDIVEPGLVARFTADLREGLRYLARQPRVLALGCLLAWAGRPDGARFRASPAYA